MVTKARGAKTIIWVEDGSAFEDWEVNGLFLGAGQDFQVRFGSREGERRAYFTETARGTICELSVTNNELFIAPTNLLPPQ